MPEDGAAADPQHCSRRKEMQRREFIKFSGAALTTTALPNMVIFAQSTAMPSPRTVLPINQRWRFHPAVVEGAHLPGFDDAAFEKVVVPHTNIALPWHGFSEKEYLFISTYRRRFQYPAAAKGKRVFVDFEGAMTASTVWINGAPLGEYKGGFTPFSFELTPHLKADGENVLVVQVDSTERADIPPFGYEIDYLTFGGLYREVSLRIVSPTYIDNIFAHPKDVLSGDPSVDVDVFLAGDNADSLAIEVELLDGNKVIARERSEGRLTGAPDTNAAMDPVTSAPVYASTETIGDPAKHTVTLKNLKGIKLWELQTPQLYDVRVRLLKAGKPLDEDTRRIGFREATFTDHGFSLNGSIVKLRGLDRHQTFPYVGQAMPARVQRKDADILRKELHCNIVRTSHYPQSRHFLDRCDEIGLLVLEEIPGWQHIGPEPWKLIAIDNVGRMVRRDWNHPSIVLWGVRINESKDDHNFYVRTNALSHALDTTRQTGGIRYLYDSELLEDVMTMNDFGFPLKKPNHPRYLNTEFVGHTFPTRIYDNNERLREHMLRHARIHNQLASDPQYAGGIGWCAFDYNTHANFGSGDRICYHGVSDIFRQHKPAGLFYKSQCDPAEEIVLEPGFHWARNDESTSITDMPFLSNCDHIKLYLREASLASNDWKLLAEADPDRKTFEHLKYAPFNVNYETDCNFKQFDFPWGDLRIDGYLNGKKVIEKTLSGTGVDARFVALADDIELRADGADTTRVVLRGEDEYGALRPLMMDAITFTLDGPAQMIGDNPFGLIGGAGAVWIRAGETAGDVTLTAKHPRLGTQTIKIKVTAAPSDAV
jgi:beta-galactosidase